MGPDQYGLARFAVGICVCRATCPQAALRRARRHNAGFRRRNGAAVCAVALGVRRAAARNQRLIYKQMPEWCLSRWRSISTTTRDTVAAGSVRFAPQWFVAGWGPTSPRGSFPSLPDVAEHLSQVLRLLCPLSRSHCTTDQSRVSSVDNAGRCAGNCGFALPRRDGQERSFGQFAFM